MRLTFEVIVSHTLEHEEDMHFSNFLPLSLPMLFPIFPSWLFEQDAKFWAHFCGSQMYPDKWRNYFVEADNTTFHLNKLCSKTRI